VILWCLAPSLLLVGRLSRRPGSFYSSHLALSSRPPALLSRLGLAPCSPLPSPPSYLILPHPTSSYLVLPHPTSSCLILPHPTSSTLPVALGARLSIRSRSRRLVPFAAPLPRRLHPPPSLLGLSFSMPPTCRLNAAYMSPQCRPPPDVWRSARDGHTPCDGPLAIPPLLLHCISLLGASNLAACIQLAVAS